MLGDINAAEPGALIGFAGPRVIKQTVRETLPEGFQRSEFLLEHGAIDMIIDRREMRNRLSSVLCLLTHQPGQPVPEAEAFDEELEPERVGQSPEGVVDPSSEQDKAAQGPASS